MAQFSDTLQNRLNEHNKPFYNKQLWSSDTSDFSSVTKALLFVVDLYLKTPWCVVKPNSLLKKPCRSNNLGSAPKIINLV